MERSGQGTDRDTVPELSLEGLRKIMTNFTQDSSCPGQDSNEAHPQYKSQELTLGPACLIFMLLRLLLIHHTDQHATNIQHVTKTAAS
jgi:hypothetical protein